MSEKSTFFKELRPSSRTYELRSQGKKKSTKSRQTNTSHCPTKTTSKPDTPSLNPISWRGPSIFLRQNIDLTLGVRVGCFMVQKIPITSPISVFQGLRSSGELSIQQHSWKLKIDWLFNYLVDWLTNSLID